jgi:hypothetical protein
MIEFRIYYECLEQAHDYIHPIVNFVTKENFPVKLIKRPKSAERMPDGVIRAIQLLTTSDILITAVKDEIEYPLVLIEFSEAVSTEDHELQRTYGAVAAYLAGIYYVKISGNKQSEKIFGGAEYDPYTTAKILVENFNYEGYIIADWGTQVENTYTLLRHESFPACPPEIAILVDTIQQAVSAFLESEETWFAESLKSLKELPSYKEFQKQLNKGSNAKALLKNWSEREERNKNLNKLRFFVRPDWVGAKINRLSHAMDPDRGILTFISFLFSDTKKVYGVYALVRPGGSDVMKKPVTDLASLKEKFTAALAKDEGGIPAWLVEELEATILGAITLDQQINFQPVWEKHKDKIAKHKVVATLAFFLDGIKLNHNGITLYWDRRALLGDKDAQFLSQLKKAYHFATKSKPSLTVQESILVDEDEVTYALIHRILIPNGFQIVSVSYPGSQGGGAVLPKPDLGKSQPREYPDVIALPPAEKKSDIDVILSESKGMYSAAPVMKDVTKLIRYKTEAEVNIALTETLVVAKVIDKDKILRNILIGVAFGATSKYETTWQPTEIDFIFCIKNRSRWSIGIFKQALNDLIPKIEGDTDFPDVHKITY